MADKTGKMITVYPLTQLLQKNKPNIQPDKSAANAYRKIIIKLRF